MGCKPVLWLGLGFVSWRSYYYYDPILLNLLRVQITKLKQNCTELPVTTAVSSQLDKLVSKTKFHDLAPLFQQHFAFLEQMQGAVAALKKAWRNKISHAHGKLVLLTSEFAPDVAEEIIMTTRAFMRRLATELPQ